MDLETWIDSQRKQLWVEIKIQIIQINILLRLEEKGNMPGIYGCSFNHKLIYWCILKNSLIKKYHEILVINII